MTVALGVMQLPVPVAGDNLPAYETGALRDGGLWTALRRLSDHDHSGGEMGGPVAGGGGGTGAEVTITGTEGVTVVESPANVFALGLTASPDANNTVQIRANGIYSASGAIPPEYVTDTELATALGLRHRRRPGRTRHGGGSARGLHHRHRADHRHHRARGPRQPAPHVRDGRRPDGARRCRGSAPDVHHGGRAQRGRHHP